MNPEQLMFYNSIEEKLSQNQHVNINGQIGYIFTYLLEKLDNWETYGYEYLYEHFMLISENYNYESKLSGYCRAWAFDCLLGMGRLEEYIRATEPDNIFLLSSIKSNLRIAIQRELGADIHSLDYTQLYGIKKNKFNTTHQTLFKDFIAKEFHKSRHEIESIINDKKLTLEIPKSKGFILFAGSHIFQKPKLNLEIVSYERCQNLKEKIFDLVRLSENEARKCIGIPEIGQGWVSETILYKEIKEHFEETSVIQHGKPSWLGRQHYDVWLPIWKIAVEYHGEQHYMPIEYFGGQESYENTVKRDKKKEDISRENGITLIVTNKQKGNQVVIDEIKEIRRKHLLNLK